MGCVRMSFYCKILHMKLSVPYIPDDKYTHFLKKQLPSIESVYFSLHSGPILDSRTRSRKTDIHELSKGLQEFKDIKKYCLVNSRFIHPDLYHDPGFLNQTLDHLETLVSFSDISGIVFSDFYFLNALSDTKRDIISHIEAVPGINCMIDTSQKAFSFFEMIEQTGFKLPRKIILDRSLNRNIKQLEKTSEEIRQRYNPIKIELLANEGCIDYCPFKLSHDAQISLSNTGLTQDKTFHINNTLGCQSYLAAKPEKIFKSPFIRPDDTERYEKIADTIKLCGRTLGFNFLSRCINAYSEKSYDGNLFSLMDAAHWLSDLWHIENKRLDPGFFNMITTCTKDCKNCKLCKNLFLKTAKKKPVTIKPYGDYL